MANLKLRIKKTILKKKLDGVTVTGYYGRVLTNGTFERFPLIGNRWSSESNAKSHLSIAERRQRKTIVKAA